MRANVFKASYLWIIYARTHSTATQIASIGHYFRLVKGTNVQIYRGSYSLAISSLQAASRTTAVCSFCSSSCLRLRARCAIAAGRDRVRTHCTASAFLPTTSSQLCSAIFRRVCRLLLRVQQLVYILQHNYLHIP